MYVLVQLVEVGAPFGPVFGYRLDHVVEVLFEAFPETREQVAEALPDFLSRLCLGEEVDQSSDDGSYKQWDSSADNAEQRQSFKECGQCGCHSNYGCAYVHACEHCGSSRNHGEHAAHNLSVVGNPPESLVCKVNQYVGKGLQHACVDV